MGLDVTLFPSNHSFHVGSYGALHRIRAFALFSTGDFDTIESAFKYLFEGYKNKNKLWEKYNQFENLIDFSDCEGLYIPQFYLGDFKPNKYLRSSDGLINELKSIKTDMIKNPEKYESVKERCNQFNKFHDNITLEIEEYGTPIIKYH